MTSESKKPTKKPGVALYSLCIPSSVISKANARNLEQATHIAYQVAKAACAYNVSEIVILPIPTAEEIREQEELKAARTVQLTGSSGNKKIMFNSAQEDEIQKPDVAQTNPAMTKSDDTDNNAVLFATLLQYFVTPPYLVKSVYKDSPYRHKFVHAQKLPKLSTLPFMNNNGVAAQFKEGLTVAKKSPRVVKGGKKTSALRKLKVTKYVNVGEETLLELAGPEVPVNVRVTVDKKNRKVVSPSEAYGVAGCKASFGYHVRLAQTFSQIFTELSFPEGYTESILVNANNYFRSESGAQLPAAEKPTLGNVLLVLGNLNDLDYAFSQDTIEGVESVSEMFDSEMAVPAGLRVEDAAMVSLTMAS